MNRLWRLAYKELCESLRDRRTIITLVLMPLLLYPVVGVMLRQVVLGSKAIYVIGFASDEERARFNQVLVGGRRARNERSQPRPDADGEVAPPHLRPEPMLNGAVVEDGDAAVRQGLIHVFVRLKSKGPEPWRPEGLNPVVCDLIYLEGTEGAGAARYLEVLTTEWNAVQMAGELAERGRMGPGGPVSVSVKALEVPGPKRSPLVGVLVPLVLILMTMTGAVYPAIDLTAGERERGTMEILAAAPIPRVSVLLAKYIAVLTVALLTALANIGSMAVTLYATGLGQALFKESFSLTVLVQVLALLVLFASFFSAILLAVTSFARSFKEAQAYLIPLMLVCMSPGVMALLPGLSLEGPLAVVPLLNIVLLARDALDGNATVALASVVVTVTLLYALAAIGIAARVFATEAVVSGETSGWGDVFRQPTSPRDHAEPSTALFCLALLFPTSFLLTAALSQLDAPVATRLIFTGVASVLLLAGFPIAAAILGRVRLESGLRLPAAPVLAWPAALLLGLSLWPFVHEATLVARQLGVTSLSAANLAKLKEALQAWRAVPLPLLLAAMAVLPAMAEELLFRGYLFSAFSEATPAQRIVSTAALFAAFHLFAGELLMVERIVPSLLMGLVLGWLAEASGSVWPGMLLHALHNGTLVAMAYYEPQLVDAGWLPGEDGHLPPLVLGVAAVVAVLGLVGVYLTPRVDTAP
jgi:ABC-2 type transport system permease protein/sodium transport system permease protein